MAPSAAPWTLLRPLFPLLLLILSCSGGKETQKGKMEDDGNEMVKVTVRDRSKLDGCHYLLLTEEGKKFNPLNMEKEYFEDGLQLRVRYEKADAMTTCMAGTNVRLIEVKRIE